MSQNAFVTDHYCSPDLIEAIEFGLVAVQKDRDQLTIDDLAAVDEFHVRGPFATLELIELLDAAPDMQVLDLGSGLGGPARRLSSATGAKVTGIDLSEDYCRTGTALNAWLGFDQQVSLSVGDATDLSRFDANHYDRAWTLHTAMNIADKAAFYSEVFRVLKPGGLFVSYDIVTVGAADIAFPVPWAQTPENSHLVSAEEMRTKLIRAGFDRIRTFDRTMEAGQFLDAGVAQLAQADGPPPLGLHLLFGSVFRAMLTNLRENVRAGRLGVVAVTCRKDV